MTQKPGNFTMRQAELLKQGGGKTRKIATACELERLGLILCTPKVNEITYELTERGKQERTRILKASEK